MRTESEEFQPYLPPQSHPLLQVACQRSFSLYRHKNHTKLVPTLSQLITTQKIENVRFLTHTHYNYPTHNSLTVSWSAHKTENIRGYKSTHHSLTQKHDHSSSRVVPNSLMVIIVNCENTDVGQSFVLSKTFLVAAPVSTHYIYILATRQGRKCFYFESAKISLGKILTFCLQTFNHSGTTLEISRHSTLLHSPFLYVSFTHP